MFTKIKMMVYNLKFYIYGELAKDYFERAKEDSEDRNRFETKGWEYIIKREYLLEEMSKLKGLV